MRYIKPVLVGVLAAAFWTAFIFFLASPALVPPQYHTPSVQHTAELERFGFLALMGVLYFISLIWSIWLGSQIQRKRNEN